jgi:WD40 repeat protein
VAFNPKNRYIIASGSWDNTVRFWDIENEQEIESYPQKKHRDIVWGVAFSPDGKYVASASKDKTIKLWNLVDGQELKTFEGHTDSVYSVAFSPDKKSKSIVSGSDDNTVKLWDIGDLDAKSNHCPNPTIRENVPQTFTGHTDSVVSVVFSKDGAKIVSASKDGTARIWQRLSQQPYHGNRITSISSDKKNIASAGADCTIKLWNLDGTLKKTLEGHAEIVSRVVFSPDGRYIASASHDRLVILWSAKGERLSTFYDHDLDKDDKNKNAVTSLAFSYYNDSYYNYVTSLALGYYNTKVKKKIIIASADKQGNIKLWYPDEIDKRNRVKGLPILDKPVNTLAFSPDGKYLVSGGDEQTINLWNMETKWKAKIEREPKELASFDRSITSIVFSPDQKSIVVGLDNSTLKLLDFNCPNVIEKAYLKSSCNSTIKLKGESQAFKGHKGSIQQVIFSPDSKLIASASDDKTIKLWNLKGQELQTFLGHSKPVSGIAFSDDKTLVSSSWDRTIRFWYLNYNLDDLLAQGCAWLHDYLVNNPKTSDDDRQMCGIPPREKLKVKSEKE